MQGMLSDRIEKFILELLDQCGGTAQVKRNELAVRFGCAPSQISYVLAKRFCPVRGYMIESRRGGGGYVRILRLDVTRSDHVTDIIEKELGGPVCMRRAEELVRGLSQAGYITKDQENLMLAAISPHALKYASNAADSVRSSVLGAMLVQCI